MKSWVGPVGTFSAIVAAGTCLAACRSDAAPRATESSSAMLRVGVGPLSSTSPTSGLRQLIQIVSVEGLGRLDDDGHVAPVLADKWTLTNGGRSLTVTIRPDAKFHDGSPVDSHAVVAAVGPQLRASLGPLSDKIERVRAVDERTVQIDFTQPSPLLLESLEVQ